MVKRALILMMDSFGIGATPDACHFQDQGSNTLGHIASWSLAQRGRPLVLPHLEDLGLGAAAREATGKLPSGFLKRDDFTGLYAAAAERSKGKDTPSGHWELAGVPVLFDWGYFPKTVPSFPPELTQALIEQGGLPGILGDCHASGTEIIAELGDEHVASGKPIVYTSADSVLQIAAHEESFGLERLLTLCKLARKLVDPYNIGRVIARPFTGTSGNYRRTPNRKDLAVPPPAPTLLDKLVERGSQVLAIGKIGDIFAHHGISRVIKGDSNAALFDATLAAMDEAGDGDLIFTNFVDFDQSFGHRRDPGGYADALEAFDKRLPELLAKLQPGDLALITADHGCDPTWIGTDHTREYVPLIFFGPGVASGNGGRRTSFADGGQTLAQHLGLPPLEAGRSLL
jgi:phosphopentomutase